jgi:hypothetical protein
VAKKHPAVQKAQDAHKQLGDALNQIAQMMAAKQQEPEQPEQQTPAMPVGVSPLGGQAK